LPLQSRHEDPDDGRDEPLLMAVKATNRLPLRFLDRRF